MSDPYNYREFPLDLDQATFDAFRDHLRAGDRAPDGDLVDAASGERVSLSSLWKRSPLVLEFGSFS